MVPDDDLRNDGMRFVLQDGRPVVREGGRIGGDDCCCDCCKFVVILNTGVLISENYYNPSCCAYLTFGIFGSPTITMPVGVNGVWTGPTIYVPFDITSQCLPSYYLDQAASGDPEHIFFTTKKRSIVMSFGDEINPGFPTIEVFLDENCCPESIQVHEPEGSEGFFDPPPALAFGPTTVAGYFEGGYPLVICSDPPKGVCCIDGFGSIGEDYTQYYCEVIGDGINPGTWHEAGTYDPEDPCNPLP